MPLESPESVAHWTAHIQDVVASDSSIREGLQDDDAIPLMDWGRAQAQQLAARMVTQTPTIDEEIADAEAHALVKLMTTISRAVVHRHAQGDDWLVKVFNRLNKTSQRVYGDNAPVMSDEAIAAWIATHKDRSNGELLRDLLARFSPPESGATPPDVPAAPAVPDPAQTTTPDTPPDQPPSAPAPGGTPLSSAVHLPDWLASRLPGRAPTADTNRADGEPLPPPTGEQHDQTE